MKTLPADIKFYTAVNSVIITDDIVFAKEYISIPHRDSITEKDFNSIYKIFGLTRLYIHIKQKLDVFDLNEVIKELGFIIYFDIKLVIYAEKVILNNLNINYLILNNTCENNEIFINNSKIGLIDNISEQSAVKLVIKDSNIPEYKEGRLRKKDIDIEVYNSIFFEYLYINAYSLRISATITAYNSHLGLNNILSNTFIFNIKGENNTYYLPNTQLNHHNVAVYENGIRLGNVFIRITYDSGKVKQSLDRIKDINEIRKLLYNIKLIKHVNSFAFNKTIDIQVIINHIEEYLINKLSNTDDN